MMNSVIFPGTFDPLTLGHVNLVHRCLNFSSKVIVAVGQASSKDPMIPLTDRLTLIQEVFSPRDNIVVQPLDGLLVDFARTHQAQAIIRGLRNSIDFDYEFQLAGMNCQLAPDIETIFLMSDVQYTAISSTLIRDVIENKADASQFIPAAFLNYLQKTSTCD